MRPRLEFVLLVMSVASTTATVIPVAFELSTVLKQLAKEELGTNILAPSNALDDPEAVLTSVVAKTEAKLQKYKDVMLKSRSKILDILSETLSENQADNSTSCCNLRNVRYDNSFGTFVNKDLACEVSAVPQLSSDQAEAIRDIFTDATSASQHRFKWQYLVSNLLHVEYPASRNSLGCQNGRLHRDVYVHALDPKPKHVLILFDRDQSLTPEQLVTGRALVQHFLASLSDLDSLGFVASAESDFFPLDPDCKTHRLHPVSRTVRTKILKFMNVVQVSQFKSNLTRSLEALVDMVKTSAKVDLSTPIQILVISGDQGRNENDTAIVQRDDLPRSVVINSYQLVQEDHGHPSPILSSLSDSTGGDLVLVGHGDDLAAAVGDFLTRSDDEHGERDPHLMSARWDSVGQGNIFSLGLAAGRFRDVKIVLGADLHYLDVMEHIAFHDHSPNSYLALVELAGQELRVQYHPRITDLSDKQPLIKMSITDVEQLEKWPEIRDRMITEPSGSKTVPNHLGQSVQVSWKWLEQTKLIVCHFKRIQTLALQTSVAMDLPHRLPSFYSQGMKRDVKTMCKNFKVPAAMDMATLFMSPTAFSSPFAHHNLPFSSTQKNYIAYLTDKTRLIANPGLKDQTRSEVARLSQLVLMWQNQTLTKRRSRPIFADHFVASTSGVFLSFPGAALAPSFDFANFEWFVKSISDPGRVILTGPRLQSKGAGYVITISQSLDGKTAAGVEVSLAFMAKQLRQQVVRSFGADHQLTTFMFDEEGYLLSHPVFLDPTYIGPIVKQHLNHKEPNVGKDLLNLSKLVEKTMCRSARNKVNRRIYEFNLSFHEEVVGQIRGQACNQYHIALVPGTNVFIGVLNSTCPSTPIFCPCSINSKDCMICPMDQGQTSNGCECPCECPQVQSDSCSSRPRPSSSKAPLCRHEPVDQQLNLNLANDHTNDLDDCFYAPCSSLTSKDDCSVVPGCSWCQVELEMTSGTKTPQFSPLARPFCADQDQCSRGAVGAINPYMQLGRENALRKKPDESRSAVGPIIGGVLVLLVFLAFSVFCYKHRYNEDGIHCTRHFFRTNGTGSLGGIEIDDEEELKEMNCGGGQFNALALECPTSEVTAVISPYKMNPGYRRPAPATDSDYGYSTMTPMSGAGCDLDSEIMPYTASAPARDRLRHRPPTSLQSVTSGLSSRTSSPAPPSQQPNKPKTLVEEPLCQSPSEAQTVLLPPHQFIVAATVHQVEVE